jgi:hypothetical protein
MGTQITAQKILAFDSFATFPLTGLDGYIYIDNLANIGYLWDNVANQYVNIGGVDNPTPSDPAPLAFANAATVGALSYSPTYNNGTLGVGATLTATVNGVLRDTSAVGKIDTSYTPVAGDIVLIKNQSSALQNGLYTITTVGSVSTPYVLTRFTDFDQSAELYPLQVNVIGGSSNNLKYFIQTTANPTIGTSNLIFSLSTLQSTASQIAFIDTVIDTALSNIVYTNGTAFPTIPGSGATLTSTVNGALGTYYGLTANTNSTIALGFTRVLLINQTNPAYNGDYQVINAGSASTKWQLRRIQSSAGGFDRYTRYFTVSNAGSTKAGKIYFTKPNSPVLTNATVGTDAINIFEYGDSGLDIGTTPITSGTVGRILFQGAGNVTQQDSNLFWDNTNKRLGIGATPSTSVRLDVRAQGALSTDIAFRVRNSADTQNILSLTGDGRIAIGLNAQILGTTSNANRNVVIGASALDIASAGVSENSVAIGYNAVSNNGGLALGANTQITGSNGVAVGVSAIAGIDSIAVGSASRADGTSGYQSLAIGKGARASALLSGIIAVGQSSYTNALAQTLAFCVDPSGANSQTMLLTNKANLVFKNSAQLTASTHWNTTATNTLTIHNGTIPNGNIVDAIQFYSADIVAGNTAPHFRTENGSIIKIYQETTAVTSSAFIVGIGTAVTDASTFDGYTISQITKALRNLGILA